MTSPRKPSRDVHMIVEFVKSRGFDFETDEVMDMDLGMMLSHEYSLRQPLSVDEYELLREELLILAEKNEIREAIRKTRELYPEDSGVMVVREPSRKPGESATAYTMPYFYPVEGALRYVPRRAGFFS